MMPENKKDNDKILHDFLEEVVAHIIGKQVEDLVDLINNKKHANEFLIAKKLDITVNQTRNMLYKLSDYGTVSYIRKKDKRKGWYTYFWRIEPLKALEFLKTATEKRLEQINYQVESRDSKLFYTCKKCNVEISEENALFYDFTCSECGNIFEVKDNTRILKELRKNLAKYEDKLSNVTMELDKEKEKVDKEKLKIIKREEKKKKEASAAKRKATAEAKKKLLAKNPVKKKPVKKKVVKKKVKKKPVKKKVVKKKVKKVPTKKKAVKKVVKKKVKKKPVKKKVKKK
jgi:transcription factor E